MNVLLSIKPKYVEEIFKGNKKYEFRKSVFRFKGELNLVYIYSTYPMKKIVGTFTIETIIEDHPKILWEKFKDFSGINEDEFFIYFGDAEKGFAIEIGKIEVFQNPADPRTLIPDFVPPQSFCYMNENIQPQVFLRRKD